MFRSLFLVLALSASVHADELRVGMDTRTPPWSFVPGVDYTDDDLTKDPVPSEAQLKAVQGIDVDVAHALARHLGATLRIVPVAWFGEEQGLGRLIRSRGDRGILAVLDSRLVEKPYGRRFLQSLPPARLVHDLAEVELFAEAEHAAS